MRIREGNEDDIPAISQLFYDTVREVNARDYSPEQIHAWAPEVPSKDFWADRFAGCQVFVVEENDRVVAFAEFENNGHIDCFYVHHKWLCQGFGSALLRHLKDEAKRRGLPSLFSEVSITAQPFFARHGFEVINESDVWHRGCTFRQYFMTCDVPV